MAHYLDPRNDLTFKRVFGEHKHLCMSLLNSLLPLEKPIVSLEYQTGELSPELEILRHSIVDVRCTDSDGRQFLVEMQMYWSERFKSRVLFNASKAYILQLDKGDEYELLQPVYALSFVNDIFEKSPEMQNDYYHHYKIVNIKNTQKQIKGLEFVFIELPKFRPQGHGQKKLHDLWLRFLTEINERTDEAPRDLMKNKETREAIKYMEIGAYTKAQLFTYDRVRDAIMTERSVLSERLEMGIEMGLEKGLQRGREEGLQKGMEEGEEKGIKKVALNLLQIGISLDDIMKSTGLTAEEIHILQDTKQ